MKKFFLAFALSISSLPLAAQIEASAQTAEMRAQQKEIFDFMQKVSEASSAPNDAAIKITKKLEGFGGVVQDQAKIDAVRADIDAMQLVVEDSINDLEKLQIPDTSLFTAALPKNYLKMIKSHNLQSIEKLGYFADNMEKLLLSAEFGDERSMARFAILLIENSSTIISSRRNFLDIQFALLEKSHPNYDTLQTIDALYMGMEAAFEYLSPLEDAHYDSNVTVEKLDKAAAKMRLHSALGRKNASSFLTNFIADFSAHYETENMTKLVGYMHDWFGQADEIADVIDKSKAGFKNPNHGIVTANNLLKQMAEFEIAYVENQQAKIRVMQ